MKFKIKELFIINGPETQKEWDIIEVKKEKNKDQLKISDKGYDNFLTSPDTKLKYEDKIDLKNKIQNTLSNINSKLEWLIGFWFTDKWKANIEYWQDTKYLKEVSWEINNATREFIKWQEKAKDNLNNGMDSFTDKLSWIKEKATSAENLKNFLNKSEDKKGKSTLNKIASFIPWSEYVKSKDSHDELVKTEKNAGHVNF